MKNILTIAFALLIGCSAWAKDVEKEAPVFHPELKTILAGTVIDHLSGEALVGVTVKVTGSDRSFFTDLDGNFLIKGLVPGNYELEVSYVSYQPNHLKQVEVLSEEKSSVKVEMKQ